MFQKQFALIFFSLFPQAHKFSNFYFGVLHPVECIISNNLTFSNVEKPQTNVKASAFGYVTPCSLVELYLHFGGSWCLHNISFC